jgi:hypothetical protein
LPFAETLREGAILASRCSFEAKVLIDLQQSLLMVQVTLKEGSTWAFPKKTEGCPGHFLIFQQGRELQVLGP